ncbi:peptidylprolyl isomerase SurA [Aliikangiella sp. G2MR2-5]|uniref:peptidylprolyl isomerase SurA n=1 Tax=Aliikangiella sp. G2MR2-5 TaxID=2788943 RepID=UPI0018AB482D|nr:peptidylprolyl isomerase SurA [Aliikangiella sp. G2MR2-5]
MTKLVKLCVVFLVSIQASLVSAESELIDRVVALVDEDVVLGSELVRRTNSVLEQLKERKQKTPPLATLRDQVLERLIIESLQLQMAKRVGVRVSDAELDAAIDRVAQQNNITSDILRKKNESNGISWAVFREDLRKDIMINRVTSGMVSRRIKISEKEVDNLVALIDKQGESRVQYAIGHIFLPLAEGSSPEEIAEVRNLAEKLIRELRNGADFAEYAISYSKGQQALSGGDLGWRNPSELPSLFAVSIKNMKTGDISEPLRSGSGLHILKLREVKGGFERHSVLQTHARHILITPNAIMDEQAAREKAALLRQRIVNGEKFEDLAMEFSDDKGSGSLGGDLKWTDPGTFVPDFSNAMDKLAIGEISEPVKTEYGYHIIEVLGRRDQDQTEEKKREAAYRSLHNRKFEEEIQLWIQEIKEQAYIKVLLEEE